MKHIRKILPLLLALLFAGTPVGFSAPANAKSPQKNAPAAATAQPKSAGTQKKAQNKKSAAADDTEDELFEGREKLPGENFSAAFPTLTRIADMVPARTVQDGPDRWIYETQHFRFNANAPIALGAIKEIAKIFEGTYTANLALPINSPCNHYQVCEHGKYNAFLYETREQYLAAGGMDGSAGVYIGPRQMTGTVTRSTPSGGVVQNKVTMKLPNETAMQKGRVLVPFPSLGLEKRGNRYAKGGRRVDAHTLSHEITHHMTIGANAYPIWFSEGIAEYVGAAYDGNGKCNFSKNKTSLAQFVAGYGTKKEAGGRGLGKQPRVGPLRAFFEQTQNAFLSPSRVQINYGFSALLVYYFLHVDGKRDAARIKKYISILQNGGSEAEANAALLDGRTWEQLEKDVRKGMKSAFKIEPQFN